MLQSLSIANIAVIDRLTIDFAGGLNVMTGETGAGKTIIAQSLALVLGARVQPDIIRTGEADAEVTAVFLLDHDDARRADAVRRFMDANGIADEGEIVVRRVVSVANRNRITVNGVPVTAAMLKTLAPHLVDVSSQHEHQLLLNPSAHVDLVDEYGVDPAVRDGYRAAWAAFTACSDEVRGLMERGAHVKDRLDVLTYQLREITDAAPKPGELDELEERRSRMKHAATLDAAARSLCDALYEVPGSVAEVAGRLRATIASARTLDASFEPWMDALARIHAEAEEIAREARAYADRVDADPASMEEIDDRIHLVRGLVRKHGGTIDDVIAKRDAIAAEIGSIENYDDVLGEKQQALQDARAHLVAKAQKLAAARQRVGAALARAVQDQLKGLAMAKVRFVTRACDLPEHSWDARGSQNIEFFFAPNVGEELRPLARIASGGELSRMLLAIKRVMADSSNLASTYIFDEVDSGIGGATAEAVGRRLMEVGRMRQVICITHLPQVACFGNAHYRIDKRVCDGRTVASVTRLSGDERVDEVARMLGGTVVSEVTRLHATEMLARCSNGEAAHGR